MLGKACLGVIEGLKETRDARKAFLEAAKEADILVERDPGVECRPLSVASLYAVV
ncbi:MULTISPECIES: DUF982 domain-containing protein [Mesorhizobium]|uniref:DUF982 domain-containing protein n=1 Tax=Mesorhizobium TaxID=68287 RepID=UPI0010A96FFF|nr:MULTISPECIES: DUF982 domain-containing protein [Mesorhizobium]